MTRNGIALIGCTLFCFLVGLLPCQTGEAGTQIRIPSREYIISIRGEPSDDNLITSLSPRDVRVGRDDPVTWVNESPVEVRIKFGRGEPCKKVLIKTFGWRLEPDKCYETEDTLRPGYSTTVRFREVGLFNYEIEYVGKSRKEKGVIRVQSEDR